MGKIGFSPIQEKVFNEFIKEDFARNFYFSGGTALSVFYLKHRISDDLDFFAEKDFDNLLLIGFFDQLTQKMGIKYRFTQYERTRIFEVVKKDKMVLKMDFTYYPYRRIEKGTTFGGMEIDSFRDIGTNKLLCINQRTNIKDFVDLYYIFQKYTLWDLLYGIEAKFNMDLDLMLISGDFMKVEQFDFLPKMLVPLTLSELTNFFREKAIKLGEKITKK